MVDDKKGCTIGSYLKSLPMACYISISICQLWIWSMKKILSYQSTYLLPKLHHGLFNSRTIDSSVLWTLSGIWKRHV